MAVDTLAKRASIASIGLAFLGPSVIPSGAIGQAERQVVGNSYYGVLSGSGSNSIGGTSQLGNNSSTGGVTTERAIGGTAQIGLITSTGGLTLERILGGTSQLGNLSSSGGITDGNVQEEVGGGYVPPTYVKHKLRKKDKDILEQVQALVSQVEGLPEPPKEIIKEVKAVEVKAAKVVDISALRLRNKQVEETKAKLQQTEALLNKHIQEIQQDEDDAINALLQVI